MTGGFQWAVLWAFISVTTDVCRYIYFKVTLFQIIWFCAYIWKITLSSLVQNEISQQLLERLDLCANILGPQRGNPNYFGDSLTLFLVPLWGWYFWGYFLDGLDFQTNKNNFRQACHLVNNTRRKITRSKVKMSHNSTCEKDIFNCNLVKSQPEKHV